MPMKSTEKRANAFYARFDQLLGHEELPSRPGGHHYRSWCDYGH
jgi:hypothetical protein